MFWNWIVMLVAQLYKYTKNSESDMLNGEFCGL